MGENGCTGRYSQVQSLWYWWCHCHLRWFIIALSPTRACNVFLLSFRFSLRPRQSPTILAPNHVKQTNATIKQTMQLKLLKKLFVYAGFKTGECGSATIAFLITSPSDSTVPCPSLQPNTPLCQGVPCSYQKIRQVSNFKYNIPI